jgi:hypothetical protein
MTNDKTLALLAAVPMGRKPGILVLFYLQRAGKTY